MGARLSVWALRARTSARCTSYFRDNSDIPYQTYDPERAIALLEEVGYDFDQEIRFDTFTERPWGLVGDALVAQLTEIGVKLSVQKPDFNTFAAYFYDTKDYWLGNSSWTGGGVDLGSPDGTGGDGTGGEGR